MCDWGIVSRVRASEEGTSEPLEGWMEWLSGQRVFRAEGMASAKVLSLEPAKCSRTARGPVGQE